MYSVYSIDTVTNISLRTAAIIYHSIDQMNKQLEKP